MKITVLDGSPAPGALVEWLVELNGQLDDDGHDVTVLALRDLKIRACVGCFDCWVKTPGRCHVQDDSHEVLSAVINSNLVIFASPILMGFTSAILKRAHDKFIPLLVPYTAIVQNEMHHVKRYDSYPRWGLILEKGEGADIEDVQIVSEIYRRDAINFHTAVEFTHTIDSTARKVAHAIDHI